MGASLMQTHRNVWLHRHDSTFGVAILSALCAEDTWR